MSINVEEAGNPRRKTKAEDGPRNPDGKDPSSTDTSGKSSSSGRSARISVTPQDPGRLEELAEELGLPKSKVYNMAFQALLEKLGRE